MSTHHFYDGYIHVVYMDNMVKFLQIKIYLEKVTCLGRYIIYKSF